MAAVFILGFNGFVLAQYPNPSSHPTSLSNLSGNASDPLNQRWKTLKAQILSDSKSGKLTQVQAVEMVKKLKGVNRLSKQLKRKNPNCQLTADQKTQINHQLARSLPIFEPV